MQIQIKKEFFELSKRDRKVGSEAPAVRVKMLDETTKVIGMMAPLTQVMITLPYMKDFNNGLNDILKKYSEKSTVYIISSCSDEELKKLQEVFSLDKEFISNDFKNFANKFGVNIEDRLVAKSLFIIDKEGEIKYKEIPTNLDSQLDLKSFESNLEETINFKRKGHVHENWMGV